MQMGWVYKDPFMQLPDMTEEDCQKLKAALPKKTTIYKYAIMNELERKSLFYQVFPGQDEKYMQHEQVMKSMPLIKMTMKAEVIGEEGFVVGDVLNVNLRIDFLNLEKGQQSGYVHSRSYPYLKKDSWFLILTEQTMTGLAAVEKIDITQDFYEKEIQEMISRPGPINFVAILTNDSYKGLDQLMTCSVNVVERSENRKEYQYKKFDIDAIENPISMFQAELEDEETADEIEGGEVKIELDKDELKRRLKEAGLETAFEAFEEQLVEEQNPKRVDDNPFIPEILKNLKQLKEEAELEKKAAENAEKIKEADKMIMAQVREPYGYDDYTKLLGLQCPMIADILIYVPITSWSIHNPYFDGIKYCGPIGMLPLHPLNYLTDTIYPKPKEEKQEKAAEGPGEPAPEEQPK